MGNKHYKYRRHMPESSNGDIPKPVWTSNEKSRLLENVDALMDKANDIDNRLNRLEQKMDDHYKYHENGRWALGLSVASIISIVGLVISIIAAHLI